MARGKVVAQECQADTVERGVDDERHVIDNQWSVHGDGQGLLPLLKFPAVQTGRAVSKVDALVFYEIARGLRLGMRAEIRGRADDGGSLVWRHSHGDHVLSMYSPK